MQRIYPTGLAHIETRKDSSHYGYFEVELAAGLSAYMDTVKAGLESLGFKLVDFSEWGVTYFSKNDPSITADVDEFDSYSESSQLVLRKGKLLENQVEAAREYLQHIYNKVAIDADIVPVEPAEEAMLA